MKLDEIVTWYQKKIGTCDKQQWEKTVEQKILDGFRSVTLKNAKLKTELIDVDLVRGSTFPKAKPKQTLLTVIRLAILRYFFLPIYAQWWVKQTSPNTFAILLLMYITQMITWAVYTFNIHRIGDGASGVRGAAAAANITNTTTLINDIKNDNINIHNNDDKQNVEEHIVSLSDLLIPMTLSLLLSLIHSQIVATNTASGAKVKRRRFSNASQSTKHSRDPRVRRRKKLVKVRNQDLADSTAAVAAATATVTAAAAQHQQRKPITAKKYQSGVEVLTKIKPLEVNTNTEYDSTVNCSNVETFNTTSDIVRNVYAPKHSTAAIADDVAAALPSSIKLTLDLSNIAVMQSSTAATAADCCIDTTNTNNSCSNTCTNSNNLNHKKRNVNWHSPIHNYAIETQEKQQQTSSQSSTTTSELNSPNTTNLNINAGSANFENVYGSNISSSSNTNSNNSTSNVSPNKTIRIDDCVQEFYDDLIKRTDFINSASSSTSSAIAAAAGAATTAVAATTCIHNENAQNIRRHIGEDDGFESLNGKSSSGEENSPLPTAAAMKNQLRLRLNATVENRSNLESNQTAACYRRNVPSSIFDIDRPASACSNHEAYQQTKKLQTHGNASTEETDEEGDDGDGETISSPNNTSNYNECTTSATEWLGVTTNSEECSYSSELENSDDFKNNQLSDEDGYDLDYTPTTILNSHGTTDRISCTIWDQREVKKAQMSVLEISSCIIERVESMPETYDYIYIGIGFSFLLSFIPSFCRLCEITISSANSGEINYFDVPMLLWQKASFSTLTIFRFAFGQTQWERTVLIIGLMQRLCLTMILFIIFAVAERTFKQRFLYAKLFSHLTSSRRARKSNLPHFRLNKVRNIKTWLSVRSYLKKRGPQRSVDVIVSAAFIVTLLLLAFLSVEWLKDSVHLHSHLNLEALMWSTTIGIFLLRFMTLGNKIHHKYRSVSVLITEQINLYLQIEQKPKKKDELMVSNSVLKLAADLLKELESPFKISGLSANPYLFTTIKVVILSALSGVLSEMLGFKLKLHKIKIK